MTNQEIKLVKNSWRKLMGIDHSLIGDVFYSRLFTQQPGLRKMFPSDMTHQNKKLVDMLVYVIAGLDHNKGLTTEITHLGMHHQKLGTTPHHYEVVGDALIWTLEKGLGQDWNEELKNAWISCYVELAENLQKTSSIPSR